MCDPVTALFGLGGNKAASAAGLSRSEPAAAVADPAVDERANAEARAAQSAQARLAADQRRRRMGAGLLSKGAPASVMDAETATIQPVTNATPARAQSMLARGAPATFYGQ